MRGPGMDDCCSVEESRATKEEAVALEDGLDVVRLNVAWEEVRELELQKRLTGEAEVHYTKFSIYVLSYAFVAG